MLPAESEDAAIEGRDGESLNLLPSVQVAGKVGPRWCTGQPPLPLAYILEGFCRADEISGLTGLDVVVADRGQCPQGPSQAATHQGDPAKGLSLVQPGLLSSVPVLPCPEASAAVVPLPSSKCHSPCVLASGVKAAVGRAKLSL